MLLLNFLFFITSILAQHHHHQQGQHSLSPSFISNRTLGGLDKGCNFKTRYVTTSVASFDMCVGQTNQELKNGMSIINLIESRGYLPTCRVMHLMLWMFSEVTLKKQIQRESFVDIGANIGSCTVHMASLGFPVISVEPVRQHVDAIKGSMDINPSFKIELYHAGISSTKRSIKANFGHGSRNWGASYLSEAKVNQTYETELQLLTVEQVVGHRKVSLMKIDCEGCEWQALKGAKRILRRVHMIKLELVQPTYEDGNETVTAQDILYFLGENGFEIFQDLWAENHLYFGQHGKTVIEIDKFFGSTKFKLQPDLEILHSAAKRVLNKPINATTFHYRTFVNTATDVIAIEKSLCERMRRKWLFSSMD